MAYQGEYDGLCGMYAVANAFTECGVKNGHRVFRLACRALEDDLKWPKGVWAGTDFDDMKKMLAYCKEHVSSAASIQFQFPFEDDLPRNNKRYVERLQQFLSDETTVCAIVGASYHWFVVKKPNRNGKTIQIVDSYAFGLKRNIYSKTLVQEDLDYESLVVFVQ